MNARLRESIRKHARAAFAAAWREAFALRRVRRPSAWATEERRIEVGQSPLARDRAIRYSHAIMPHCVEPMDAADDEGVNITVLWFARRMGKTEAICCNVFGRTVTDSPGNAYSMWPIEKSSRKFSRDTINPMIEATPSLRGKFFQAKSRDAGRTIEYLRYAGGSLYIVYSGSPSATRGMAAKLIMLHEVDDPAYGEGEGGDILERALGRGEGFGDAIKFIESTGTFTSTIGEDRKVKYRSRIARWYDRGDKRKWFCQCRKCGQLQWIKFERFVSARGMEDTEYLCERCDTEHSEVQWRRMVSDAAWFPTAGLTDAQLLNIEANAKFSRAKDPIVRSYWINGFNSLLPKGKGFKSKLHQFVAEAARAKESPATHQVWVNEVDATLWNPDTGLEPPTEWKHLFERREDYATEERIIVPAGGLVITSGIDVHPNRIELSWLAFGREEKSWVLDHLVLDGDTHRAEIWDNLTLEMQRDFEHESGARIGLSFALCDASYGAEDVLRWLAKIPSAGRIRACRGASKFPHPLIDMRYRTLAGNLRGHWVGGDVAKDTIYSRLRLLPRADGTLPTGWIHFGKRLTQTYFEQLCSERVSIDEDERRYKNEEQARNETLDCFVYGFAAFKRRLWSFDLIERELNERAAQMKKGVVAPVKKKIRVGYAGGME